MKRAAVTYRFDDDVGPYVEALRIVGIEPILVKPGCPTGSLDQLSGLLMSGGTDVNPAVYGAARDPRTEDPDDDLDSLELGLVRQALNRDIPVLAICRGMQLLNVASPGGTLFQHIDGHSLRGPDRAIPAHRVVIEPGSALSRIMGSGEHAVNSRHHQAVHQPGAGVVVSARADDQVIEAVELRGPKFAIAVQWHPENQVYAFPEQRRLFEAFRDAL